jgi:flagellar biosynthesis/type III secretory pathway ATPase
MINNGFPCSIRYGVGLLSENRPLQEVIPIPFMQSFSSFWNGNFGKGSITGVFTVLVEGDDTN